MEWLPIEREKLVKDAVRVAPRVAVPSRVVPSKKDIVPVGEVEPGVDGLTVAVKVTAASTVWGFALDVRAVEVAIGAGCTMVSISGEDVLLMNVESPP